MSDANQFYQLAYGLTTEKGLDRLSMSVGVLAEGYINFGWPGSLAVMFLVGILFDFWNETFLRRRDQVLAIGIGIALLPQLLIVESQMAQYVSGLIQHIILTILVLAPIIKWGSISVRTVSSGAVGPGIIRSSQVPTG
jgi:hypothetical protein